MGFWSILIAILILGIIVFFHELGHFSVARLFKFKVIEFAVGMGPKLVSKTSRKNGIMYSLRALPFGGYCKFYGEDEDLDDPDAMNKKPVWQRFLVVAAGPLMNIVIAILVGIILFSVIGIYVVTPEIAEVAAGTPAAAAGIQAGDVIVAVNGEEADSAEAISEKIAAGGESFELTVERDGQRQNIQVSTYFDEELQKSRVGITFGQEKERYGIFSSIGESVKLNFDILGQMLGYLGNLFFKGEGVNDIMGPVGTIGVMSEMASQGFVYLLQMVMLISLNLGLINLLPLPALDGGRLVFLIIEGIRRKPIDPNKEGLVHMIGLVVLFGIMLLFTYKDIVRLIGGS
ncbi:RIP metalloprotease RseP [Gehongia tenuis]|uniref:Zinc metalloprotease n=1 Tax=Gehongia tenuis TaxID=2763655 RepID=A0A926HKL0_9FIRM|nr:RIP metalloprotease RseP [Gehongia tenuis]MBC8531107.1 RIP metalloprotease RseP [Gehongia tenuis]